MRTLKFKKILAGFLSLTLSGNPLASATAVSSAPDPFFSVSKEWGTIQEVFKGKSGQRLLLIQDAHDSLEAQKNIAGIITEKVHQAGISTVYEEGYEGPVPTDEYFASIQNPVLRQKAAYYFMDQLRLGGAEYAHINRERPFRLIGIEDLRLYLNNLEIYQEAGKEETPVLNGLEAFLSELEELARRYFPAGLKQKLKIKRYFDEGRYPFADYLKHLNDEIHFEKRAGEYPALAKVMGLLQSGPGDLLSAGEISDSQTVFRELEKAEHEWFGRLQNERDQKIYDGMGLFSTFQKLARLQMSSEEYEWSRARLDKFQSQEWADFIAHETHLAKIFSRTWESKIRAAVRFYEMVQKRDQAVIERLQRLLQAPDFTSAILVFGGFHRKALTRFLKEKDVSYAVVLPQIQSPSKRHQDLYREKMTAGGFSPRTALAPARLWLEPEGKTAVFETGKYLSESELPLPPDERIALFLDQALAKRSGKNAADPQAVSMTGEKRSEIRSEWSKRARIHFEAESVSRLMDPVLLSREPGAMRQTDFFESKMRLPQNRKEQTAARMVHKALQYLKVKAKQAGKRKAIMMERIERLEKQTSIIALASPEAKIKHDPLHIHMKRLFFHSEKTAKGDGSAKKVRLSYRKNGLFLLMEWLTHMDLKSAEDTALLAFELYKHQVLLDLYHRLAAEGTPTRAIYEDMTSAGAVSPFDEEQLILKRISKRSIKNKQNRWVQLDLNVQRTEKFEILRKEPAINARGRFIAHKLESTRDDYKKLGGLFERLALYYESVGLSEKAERYYQKAFDAYQQIRQLDRSGYLPLTIVFEILDFLLRAGMFEEYERIYAGLLNGNIFEAPELILNPDQRQQIEAFRLDYLPAWLQKTIPNVLYKLEIFRVQYSGDWKKIQLIDRLEEVLRREMTLFLAGRREFPAIIRNHHFPKGFLEDYYNFQLIQEISDPVEDQKTKALLGAASIDAGIQNLQIIKMSGFRFDQATKTEKGEEFILVFDGDSGGLQAAGSLKRERNFFTLPQGWNLYSSDEADKGRLLERTIALLILQGEKKRWRSQTPQTEMDHMIYKTLSKDSRFSLSPAETVPYWISPSNLEPEPSPRSEWRGLEVLLKEAKPLNEKPGIGKIIDGKEFFENLRTEEEETAFLEQFVSVQMEAFEIPKERYAGFGISMARKFMRLLEDRIFLFLVSEEGTITGYTHVLFESPEIVYASEIGTVKKRDGRSGRGFFLMDTLLAILKTRGAHEVYWVSHLGAESFHEHYLKLRGIPFTPQIERDQSGPPQTSFIINLKDADPSVLIHPSADDFGGPIPDTSRTEWRSSAQTDPQIKGLIFSEWVQIKQSAAGHRFLPMTSKRAFPRSETRILRILTDYIDFLKNELGGNIGKINLSRLCRGEIPRLFFVRAGVPPYELESALEVLESAYDFVEANNDPVYYKSVLYPLEHLKEQIGSNWSEFDRLYDLDASQPLVFSEDLSAYQEWLNAENRYRRERLKDFSPEVLQQFQLNGHEHLLYTIPTPQEVQRDFPQDPFYWFARPPNLESDHNEVEVLYGGKEKQLVYYRYRPDPETLEPYVFSLILLDQFERWSQHNRDEEIRQKKNVLVVLKKVQGQHYLAIALAGREHFSNATGVLNDGYEFPAFLKSLVAVLPELEMTGEIRIERQDADPVIRVVFQNEIIFEAAFNDQELLNSDREDLREDFAKALTSIIVFRPEDRSPEAPFKQWEVIFKPFRSPAGIVAASSELERFLKEEGKWQELLLLLKQHPELDLYVYPDTKPAELKSIQNLFLGKQVHEWTSDDFKKEILRSRKKVWVHLSTDNTSPDLIKQNPAMFFLSYSAPGSLSWFLSGIQEGPPEQVSGIHLGTDGQWKVEPSFLETFAQFYRQSFVFARSA